MVGSLTITNRLLVKGKVEERTAELELPSSRPTIAHALEMADMEDVSENGWMNVKWCAPFAHQLEMTTFGSMDIGHIYEVNDLAERIDRFNNEDTARFCALCDCFLDPVNSNPEKYGRLESSIANAINLTYNVSDKIQVITQVDNLTELGVQCVSHKLMHGFENISSTALSYLDFTKIGRDYMCSLDGCIQ